MPQADRSVRAAALNDAPALGALQAVVWQEAYAQLMPASILEQCTPAAFAKAWRDSLASPTDADVALIAAEGPQVVGVIAATPSTDPDLGRCVEVTQLLVGGEHRRVGHGSRLINALVDHYQGAHTLSIWIPLPMEQLRGFIQGSGLAPDGAYRDRVIDPEHSLREVRLTGMLPGHPLAEKS